MIPTTPKKIVSNFLILFAILFFNSLASQNSTSINKPIFKSISFGEKVFFGNFEDSVNWTIVSNDFSQSIKANAINEFVFLNSGEYVLNYYDSKVHNEKDCGHANFQKQSIIVVSENKMDFDFSKINFSKDFRIGSNEKVEIFIPVYITNKNNKIQEVKIDELTVAGLGVNLIATPLQTLVMTNTKNQFIKFSVSGTILNETYLMFDFVDSNKNIQTYNLLQKIN